MAIAHNRDRFAELRARARTSAPLPVVRRVRSIPAGGVRPGDRLESGDAEVTVTAVHRDGDMVTFETTGPTWAPRYDRCPTYVVVPETSTITREQVVYAAYMTMVVAQPGGARSSEIDSTIADPTVVYPARYAAAVQAYAEQENRDVWEVNNEVTALAQAKFEAIYGQR